MDYHEYRDEIEAQAHSIIHENLTLPLYEDEFDDDNERLADLYEIITQIVHDHEWHIYECHANAVLDCVEDPNVFFEDAPAIQASSLWEFQQHLIYASMVSDLSNEIGVILEAINDEEEAEAYKENQESQNN